MLLLPLSPGLRRAAGPLGMDEAEYFAVSNDDPHDACTISHRATAFFYSPLYSLARAITAMVISAMPFSLP